MRQIRMSGSEGGETALKAVLPTPIAGVWPAVLCRGVFLRRCFMRHSITVYSENCSHAGMPVPVGRGEPNSRAAGGFEGAVRGWAGAS